MQELIDFIESLENLLILGNAILNGFFCYASANVNLLLGIAMAFLLLGYEYVRDVDSSVMALGLIGSSIGVMMGGNSKVKEEENKESSSDKH